MLDEPPDRYCSMCTCVYNLTVDYTSSYFKVIKSSSCPPFQLSYYLNMHWLKYRALMGLKTYLLWFVRMLYTCNKNKDYDSKHLKMFPDYQFCDCRPRSTVFGTATPAMDEHICLSSKLSFNMTKLFQTLQIWFPVLVLYAFLETSLLNCQCSMKW